MVPFLTEEDKLSVFLEITLECLAHRCKGNLSIQQEPASEPSQPAFPSLPVSDEPLIVEQPEKKPKLEGPVESQSAMDSLFGDVYVVKVEKPESLQDRAENEVFS